MLFAFLVCLFLFSKESSATHFRYGNVTWTYEGGNTVTFHITQAWRRSFAWNTTPVVGGLPVFTGNFFFGDSTQAPMNVNVTAVNITENWFYGIANITHTYSGEGPWTAYFGSCCRISTLQNNFDGNFRVETQVDFRNGNNSPISTLQPIVNLSTGLSAATFTIHASDPDKDALTFSLSLPAEMGDATLTQPPGLTIDASTGVVTWNTIGRAVDEMWNASVRISDGNGGVVSLDFLIKIVAQSNPPYFNYAVTPYDGQVFTIEPGVNLSFPVEALDDDIGDTVTLQGFGLPIGAVMTPALPLNGNPVQSVFSWTPTIDQVRPRIVSFMAQDLTGNQTTTSVLINVTQKPLFDSPPTPADGSGFCIPSGVLYIDTIQAHSPDSLKTLQITSAITPMGVVLTPSTPTPSGNISATILNWLPAPSNWGPNLFSFSATDDAGDSTTTTFSLVVNTPTVFTSLPPVLTISENQLFVYNITASDPDVPFGDELEILGIVIPSWLTLTDNGDGTAVLSGTPGVANVGSHSIHIDAEDIYHHCFGHGSQLFTINVIQVCSLTTRISAKPGVVIGYCEGQSVQLSAFGGDSFVWSTGETTQRIRVIAGAPITYSVTATSGNCSATASFTVISARNIAPRAICKNTTVALDASGNASITAADVDGGSFDNCSSITRSVSPSSFNCSNIGANTVTLTVTDEGGLAASCQATVTVTAQAAICTASSSTPLIYLGYGVQSALLSVNANAPLSYLWSPAAGLSCTNCASPIFTPTAEGMFTFRVAVTNTSGCASVCSVSVCVLDIRVPGTDGTKIYVCHAHPSIPANSNTLAVSINAVSSHVPLHSGDFLGRCDQHCASSFKTDEEQTAEMLTSESDELQVVSYPNPFSAQFKLRVESQSSAPVDIRMFDVTGKLVLESKGHLANEDLILGKELSKGIYFTQVQQDEAKRMFRMVKVE